MKNIVKIIIISFLLLSITSLAFTRSSGPNIISSGTPGQLKEIVPLYQLRNDRDQDHIYTTNLAEKNSFEKKGCRFEGVIGAVYKNQVPNTVPLYRLYNPAEKNHFYTIRDNYTNLINRSINPYNFEGIVGYVYTGKVDDAIPLYRLRSDSEKNHFYTTDPDARESAIKKGYRYERIECFILPPDEETKVFDSYENVVEIEKTTPVVEDGLYYAGNATSDGNGSREHEGKGGTAAKIPRDRLSLNDVIVIEQLDGEIYSIQVDAYYTGGLYADPNWSSVFFSIKGIKEGENETIEIPIGEKSSIASAIKQDDYYSDFRVRINTYQQSPCYRPKVGTAKVYVRNTKSFRKNTSLDNIMIESINSNEKYPRIIFDIKNNDTYYNQACKIFIAYNPSNETDQFGVLQNYQTTRVGSGMFSEYSEMNKLGDYNIQFEVPRNSKNYYQIILMDTAGNIPEASKIFTLH